jgi:hypothetical protein
MLATAIAGVLVAVRDFLIAAALAWLGVSVERRRRRRKRGTPLRDRRLPTGCGLKTQQREVFALLSALEWPNFLRFR